MNELTGHPGFTNGVRHGEITSKPGAGAPTDNEEISKRTAHSAVLSVSGGKLAAQRKEGVDTKSVIDDVSITKKSASVNDTRVAEALATKRDERSQKDQSSGGDSEGFSEAQRTEEVESGSREDKEDLEQLITALKALEKRDCRRILEASDLGHALSNLWDSDSSQRLTEASRSLDTFEARLGKRLEGFDDLKKLEAFVRREHKNPEDQILASILGEVSKSFVPKAVGKKITGLKPNPRDEGLGNLLAFLQNEDHRLVAAQKRLVRDINQAYLKALLAKDLRTQKLQYRLEATVKFSRIKKANPFERLRQKLIAKLGDDEKIQTKAKSFKEITEKNWSSLVQKLVHTVSEFSNILFSGLFLLLGEVNEKFGNDLKPAPAFVRATNNGKKA